MEERRVRPFLSEGLIFGIYVLNCNRNFHGDPVRALSHIVEGNI